MEAVGFLALGLFVGSIISISLLNIPSWNDWKGTMITIFGVAFSGTVFTFIEFLHQDEGPTEALYFYPVGLVLGLIWIIYSSASANIRNATKVKYGGYIIGGLQIAMIVFLCLFTLAILFSSTARCMLPQTQPGVATGCPVPG